MFIGTRSLKTLCVAIAACTFVAKNAGAAVLGNCPANLEFANGSTLRSGDSFYFQNGQLALQNTAAFYANGATLKSSRNLYYASGDILSDGVRHYYGTGQVLFDGQSWYYSSGSLVNRGDSIYYPNGSIARRNNQVFNRRGDPVNHDMTVQIASTARLGQLKVRFDSRTTDLYSERSSLTPGGRTSDVIFQLVGNMRQSVFAPTYFFISDQGPILVTDIGDGDWSCTGNF